MLLSLVLLLPPVRLAFRCMPSPLGLPVLLTSGLVHLRLPVLLGSGFLCLWLLTLLGFGLLCLGLLVHLALGFHRLRARLSCFHLFPVFPDLRVLVVFRSPLISYVLQLFLGFRLVILEAPVSSFPFPMSIVMPSSPVVLEMSVTDAFIVPWVSMPHTVPVKPSPTGVDAEIEPWNESNITPASVIIA